MEKKEIIFYPTKWYVLFHFVDALHYIIKWSELRGWFDTIV